MTEELLRDVVPFEDFLAAHKSDNCVIANQSVIEKYLNPAEPSLAYHWENHGFCSYSDGFIWFVNPDDFQDVFNEWFPGKSGYVFARTAFGDLLCWSEDTVWNLSPSYLQTMPYGQFVFRLVERNLTDQDFLNRVLNHKLFQAAFKQLGPIDSNECYGFFPALALGGSGALSTIQKVGLKEHLHFLASLR
jgi:hypothetical protein